MIVNYFYGYFLQEFYLYFLVEFGKLLETEGKLLSGGGGGVEGGGGGVEGGGGGDGEATLTGSGFYTIGVLY